jgi:hypothetical protein
LAIQPGHNNFHVSTTQLKDHLTARAAWRNRTFSVGYHRDADEIPRALGYSFGQRHLLGAKRGTVAGIFDVAARECPSVSALNHRADFESGVRRVSALPRLPGYFDQFI